MPSPATWPRWLQTNRQHTRTSGLFSNLEKTGKLKDIYLVEAGAAGRSSPPT